MEAKNSTEAGEDKLSEFEIMPAIYSKRAIYYFSIFVTPLFGGFMLMQNLRDINKKKAAIIALGVSLLITIAIVITVTYLIPGKSSNIFLNIAGATILSEFVFRRYIPEATVYDKKQIWKPLLIAIAIVATLLFLYVYADE